MISSAAVRQNHLKKVIVGRQSFYTIENFISYRIKKDVDAHSARRQSKIARKLLPNGNRARREWFA